MDKQILTTFIIVGGLILLSGCNMRVPPAKKSSATEENAGAQPNKKIKDLNLDEAQDAYRFYKAQNNSDLLQQTIERIIQLSADQQTIKPLLRELADLAYGANNFEKAETAYEGYTLMYPGDKDSDYFFSQLVKSTGKNMLPVERDQSATKKVVERADAFIAKFGDKNRYAEDVKAVREKALLQLIEVELNQVAFYVNRYSYTGKKEVLTSARSHIQQVQDKLLSQLKHQPEQAVKDAIAVVLDASFAAKTPEEQITLLDNARKTTDGFMYHLFEDEPQLVFQHAPW